MTAKGRARAADIFFTIPRKEKKLPAQECFWYLYMKEAEAEAEAEASFTHKRVFILFPKGGIPCSIYLHSPPPFFRTPCLFPPDPFVSSNQPSLPSFLLTNLPTNHLLLSPSFYAAARRRKHTSILVTLHEATPFPPLRPLLSRLTHLYLPTYPPY